ncbi:MAG: NifB/NifX family molybdenum-iron cluster-binding protein [Candidatus Hodarchaeota archaeon]
MVKIAIPIEEFAGEASQVSGHFGRAPLFLVVELSKNNEVIDLDPIENKGEHFGGRRHASALMVDLKPDILVVKGMGHRAISLFQELGIDVLSGDVSSVREAIDAYLDNKLTPLTEGCRDARYRK